MNKKAIMLSLGFFSLTGISYPLTADELSKDEANACGALLCLAGSGGKGLSECWHPYLNAYYSISAKRIADTIKKRKNFLKLCPKSNDPGMPELVEAIANGAGRCDAETLNKDLAETRQEARNCRYYAHHEQHCDYVTQKRISKNLPSYCQVYIQNAYTDIQLQFRGVSKWQDIDDFKKSPAGKWYD